MSHKPVVVPTRIAWTIVGMIHAIHEANGNQFDASENKVTASKQCSYIFRAERSTKTLDDLPTEHTLGVLQVIPSAHCARCSCR